MRVEYHPAIEAELDEIRYYYDERSPGLGSQFIDEFGRETSFGVGGGTRKMDGGYR